MKNKLLTIFIFLISSTIHAVNDRMINLRCESGAYNGQIKKWSYNKKNLIEIYPNGYKRVYKIKTIKKNNILAEEDAKSGMHYVKIHISYKEIKVSVRAPLANYIDSNCSVQD